MIVAIGCDHAGLSLKPRVIREVEALGHTVLDLGAHAPDPSDDYPDFAKAVATAVAGRRAERGILCCGSGVGVSVAASKVRGVRAALCHDTYSAHQGVEHDGLQVLCVGARVVGEELAAELVRSFLGARFSGEERHARRLAKVTALEGEAPRVLRSSHVIAVESLARSGEFYARALGFSVRDLAPGWKIFERPEARIMAGECPGETPAGQLGDHSYFAYVEVADVDADFARAQGAGATLIKPVRDEPWGMREFGVRTVDGHRIMFGTRLAR